MELTLNYKKSTKNYHKYMGEDKDAIANVYIAKSIVWNNEGEPIPQTLTITIKEGV